MEKKFTPSHAGTEADINRVDNFGFVIHPLSTDYLQKLGVIGFITRFKKDFPRKIERLVTRFPGYRYGKILNIQSPTGRRVNGYIYAVTETPKMMLRGNTGRIYKKLIRLSRMAAGDGARLFGLGAYTKVVGDAGITVEKNSPIPLTTGNSLSAASILWAADYAVKKIGLVGFHNDKYAGRMMIIGATGSIGKVCAKLMAGKWNELVIIAPRIKALETVRQEIRAIAPDCNVIVGNHANDHVDKCDAIITCTSALRKIVDINRVKPGAIICDVSRPFDITREDARKRPDVLVIAAGELLLPGTPDIACDLGLPDRRVYACLAEVALLTLEGRFESFSLGRDLDHLKIKEMDLLARRHGFMLAPLMSHGQIVQEEDFRMCRCQAVRRLGQ